jgi:hypothetical protein
MQQMKVKNLNGAAENRAVGAGGLAHWEKVARQNAWICFVKGCVKRPSVVGLVQKEDTADATWYAVPLCDDCNRKRGQALDIWDSELLVCANVLEGTARLKTMAPVPRIGPHVLPIWPLRAALAEEKTIR